MRYLVKFEKKEMMVFISHLDTQRLFHRILKISGVELKYSNGFNPHPKMSFALPLSIGYNSVAEYMEFETLTPLAVNSALKDSFNQLTPVGIKALNLWSIPDKGKTAASLVVAARYKIEIPSFNSYLERIKDYLTADSIVVEKFSRKTDKATSVDIKPQIISINPVLGDQGSIVLIATLEANLNPEIMLRSLYKSTGMTYDRLSVRVERTAILCMHDNELAPLEHLFVKNNRENIEHLE